MFEHARRGLALRYAALFIVVLLVFSGVFLGILAIALQPSFDIAPEISNAEAARAAYAATLERIGIAVVLADAVAIGLVAAAAYYLAGRTLEPIQQAHDRQERFVADASHEMRTPLSTIRATADAALGGNAPQRPALETIGEAAKRLTSLTNDLLLLARSADQHRDSARHQVDLSVAAAETIGAVRSAQGLGTDVIRASLAPDLIVDGDEREITRILENLLDNALRYSTPEDPVHVRTLHRDGSAVVEVADRGPGISAADIGRIFQPFYRVRSDADAPPGSGLGLAIASELARANRGAIEVVSAPGAGTTFTVRFPRFR